MAYVYQVRHRETGEFYIGVKYAYGATPANTMDYLGSPKGKSPRCRRYRHLLSHERDMMDKFVIDTFDTKAEALSCEIEMHTRWFDDPLCLNGAKQTSNKFSAAFEGKEHPYFGRQHSDMAKEKMRLAKLGKKRSPHSPEVKAKMSLSQIGRKFSDEHKMKLSLAKLGKKKESKCQ